jgi:hypothetical protein
LIGSVNRLFFLNDMPDDSKPVLEQRLLIEATLRARAAVIPPPQRPRLAPIPVSKSQESQDDYGDFDLDFDDPALLAALGDVDVGAMERPDYRSKEEQMRQVRWNYRFWDVLLMQRLQAMKVIQCHYLAWNKLTAFVKGLPEYKEESDSVFRIADSWVYCWVGSMLISGDSGGDKASRLLVLAEA